MNWTFRGVKAAGRSIVALTVLMAVQVVVSETQAAPVAITNPGFQDDDVPVGNIGAIGFIPGWAVGGTAGTFEPTPTEFVPNLSAGEQLAFINIGASISQNVGAILAGVDYTLAFDAGDRGGGSNVNPPFPTDAFADFFIGSTAGPSFSQTIAAPGEGTLNRQMFTLTSLALAPFIGQDLLIGFRNVAGGFQAQMLIDDVTLDTSSVVAPVPLPAALPLFGGGVVLMGLLGWRRKRKAALSFN